MTEQLSTRERIEGAIQAMHQAGSIMTISGVAREAGISNATIHNRYPDLAERIRELAGKEIEHTAKQKLSKRRGKLKALDEKLMAKNEEIAYLKEQLNKAASVNASLDLKNQSLRAEIDTLKERPGTVVKGVF